MTGRRLVQGTVSTFDPIDWSGSIVLDDGVQLPFTRDAVAGSGLRNLRFGQRVHAAVDDHSVTALTIVTLPLSE